MLPLVLRHDALEDGFDDIPELGVLFLQQDNETSALGVEGRWDILNGGGEDLL